MAVSTIKRTNEIRSISISGTTTANANFQLPLFYDNAVPIGAIVRWYNGNEYANAYAVIGRYSSGDVGYWGIKVFDETLQSNNFVPIKNSNILGTVFYLLL